MSLLILAVGWAYTQICRIYPDGGGVYTAAKRSGVDFAVATIPPSFNAPSRGPFDPIYMTALFQVGEDLGKSATPFANEPPPYPGRPTSQPPDSK